MQTTLSLPELMNAKQDEYRYLLLDPLKRVMPWNSLHLNRLSREWGSDALLRVLRPDLAYVPEFCPGLLLLASPGTSCDEEILLSSEEYSRGELLYEKRYVCGWISSPLAPEALARLLAGLCKQIKREEIIPFYEPLRLELLQELTEEGALSSLVSQISQWCWISSSGHITVLSGKPGPDEWSLKWGAERAQNDHRNIWRILFAWKQIGATLPPDAAIQAAEAWAMTSAAGLHHISDKVCLALNALTLSANITEHADVKALLEQAARDPNEYFTQLFPALPDAFWQELNLLPHEKGF